MFTRLVSPLAIAAIGLAAGCSLRPSFAPRYPGPPRPPTSASAIQVVHDGRPTCAYDVLGTVFAETPADLASAAAEAGGSGIYDMQCEQRVEEHTIFVPEAKALKHPVVPGQQKIAGEVSFEGTIAECAARVFVCKGAP